MQAQAKLVELMHMKDLSQRAISSGCPHCVTLFMSFQDQLSESSVPMSAHSQSRFLLTSTSVIDSHSPKWVYLILVVDLLLFHMHWACRTRILNQPWVESPYTSKSPLSAKSMFAVIPQPYVIYSTLRAFPEIRTLGVIIQRYSTIGRNFVCSTDFGHLPPQPLGVDKVFILC